MRAQSTTSAKTSRVEELLARVAMLTEELAQERLRVLQLEKARATLLEAYKLLQIDLERLRRRIFEAKAERIDSTQLELEFAAVKKELDAIAGQLTGEPAELDGAPVPGADPDEPGAPPSATGAGSSDASKPRPKPRGRRDLSKLVEDKDLPTEVIEVPDPEMEGLVAAGVAERMGFDDSSRVEHRRASMVVVVLRKTKYRLAKEDAGMDPSDIDDGSPRGDKGKDGDASSEPAPRSRATTVVTARMPPEIIERSIGTPSLFAKIGVDKFRRGLPLFRLEEIFEAMGARIDRGTMSRWMESIGGTFGSTVVHAMRQDAFETASCLATDATGVHVLPVREPGRKRQACKKGHFFVQIADRDHVFFEYTERETSAEVLEMFRGFSGYVLADAKSVYDILFRDPKAEPLPGLEPDLAARDEVGCWSHARRKFFDAASATKEPSAREALFRIRRLFEYEREWRDLAPDERKERRDALARPELQRFFAWVEVQYLEVKDRRGLLRTAFVYARNQREALLRYLEDGRLPMTNNGSERELRRVAVGRKAWLFFGSDDHAQAAANWFTMIASAQLHDLEPEQYLRDLMVVLPQWPRERYIELAPKYWKATRARLVEAELERGFAWITIPPPLERSPRTP